MNQVRFESVDPDDVVAAGKSRLFRRRAAAGALLTLMAVIGGAGVAVATGSGSGSGAQYPATSVSGTPGSGAGAPAATCSSASPGGLATGIPTAGVSPGVYLGNCFSSTPSALKR